MFLDSVQKPANILLFGERQKETGCVLDDLGFYFFYRLAFYDGGSLNNFLNRVLTVGFQKQSFRGHLPYGFRIMPETELNQNAVGVELIHLLRAAAESVNEPGLSGFQLFAEADHRVKITYHMEYHGFAVSLRQFHLTDKRLLLKFMRWSLKSVETALAYCKDLRQRKQLLQSKELRLIIPSNIPRVEPGTEQMPPLQPSLRNWSATDAHQRRSRLLRNHMSMYIPNFHL